MMPNVAVPCPDAGIPQYRVTLFPIALDDVAPSDDKAAMNSVDAAEPVTGTALLPVDWQLMKDPRIDRAMNSMIKNCGKSGKV
jgi:hypothetical protein